MDSSGLGGEVPSTFANLRNMRIMWAFDCSLTGKIRDFIGKWELDQSYNTLIHFDPDQSFFPLRSLRDSLIHGSIPSDIGEYQSLQTLLNSSFAIKCGGGDALKVDKIVYEVDGYDLGGASFVVLDTEKWAVSDAGWYPDGKFNTHVQNTGSQGTGTTIPELYRISRQSPGSLTWKSHGRHVFDIYIQGTLRSKDFDISKKTGGDRRAITEKFNAMVTENYLEIQLFWAGKGTCCIPTGGSYGPLISALSVIPDFTPTVGIARKKNQTWLVVVLLGIGPKPKTFSYAELGSATKDFKSSNKLGEGGFRPVYKLDTITEKLVPPLDLSSLHHSSLIHHQYTSRSSHDHLTEPSLTRSSPLSRRRDLGVGSSSPLSLRHKTRDSSPHHCSRSVSWVSRSVFIVSSRKAAACLMFGFQDLFSRSVSWVSRSAFIVSSRKATACLMFGFQDLFLRFVSWVSRFV
ncbi:hypothetical protein Patl1_11709 [Pistacia atlantica]|uniref:Uncharacterized protein n=1 Tax=Pistacia atlantica TaxID=434234 RepID=A0ACC1A7S9_9ROSI|nr:hypothetical protein Patl1_11709 [Pistacia atlantica]